MVTAGESKPPWQVEWEKTVQEAKREARLVLYVSEAYEEVFRHFQKKYPEIKVIVITGRGSQVAQRVMAERRAGQYLADVYLGGSGTAYEVFYEGKILEPLKPHLILPEVLDESKWWSGKHIYHDDESRYILAFNGVVQSYFSYNTRLVSAKEVRSYWDFLHPNWKGKIVSYDPVMGGAVSGVLMFLYHNPKLGPEFIKRFLGEMDLMATRDSRQLVDWLATGRYSIAALVPPDRAGIYDARAQGLAVNVFDSRNFKEGSPLSTSSGNLALFSRAAHPHAVKLAINWLLSREGQMVVQKVDPDKDSLRIDIPKESVRPHVRRAEGGNYLILAGPGFKDMDPVQRIVKEAWKKKM